MTPTKVDATKLITVRQYADNNKLTTSYVYRLIRENKFSGGKVIEIGKIKFIEQ